MTSLDPNRRAELIESIHQPWKATLGECLSRWRTLDPTTRERSYLVILEAGRQRRTLNAHGIEELARLARA